MIRKYLVLVVLFLMGCGLVPTSDDFPPPPPMTPIVEWPQATPTVTLEPRMRPILPDDMQDAQTFFLRFKTSVVAGDDVGVAELIKYPLRVRSNGQERMLHDQSEFLNEYETIFDPNFANTVFEIEETSIILTPNGMQVGNGELWFNYFCVDLACSDSHFLITQINE